MTVPSRLAQLRIAARLRHVLAERARLDAADDRARAAWQAARLDALRRHAVERSTLYRQLHRGMEGAPLDALPTVTKADVVDRFTEVVTDPRLRPEHLRGVIGGDASGLALGRYRVGVSSGSSGRPGSFPFDDAEWVGLLANAARARAVSGRPAVEGRVRSAKVGSPSPWHLSRQVAGTLQDPRKPSLTLDASSDVAELAEALESWRPHVLTAYASVLAALAEEQLAGRLHIDPVQVFSGGERLTAAARARIAAAWGAAPFDQYVTTEAGFVAIECPAHDGLHILDDHVVVEVVDDAGSPVEPGAFGRRVLLTVLGSRTLPLIRYELDDVAALAEGACPCGRRTPRLLAVTGSARELLRLPGEAGGEVAIHPVAITAVLDAAPVRGWQVVHGSGRLSVLVVGPERAFDAIGTQRALAGSLAAAGAAPVEVEVREVATLVRSPSGKASLVVPADATMQR